MKPKEPGKNELTRKQREAIPHLIGARSLEAGCRKAGIVKSTLWHWMKEKSFREEMEKSREEVISDALQRLKNGISKAIDELLKLVEDKNKLIKIRAAEKVLDFYLRVKELDEVEGRLQTIEKIILEKRTYG